MQPPSRRRLQPPGHRWGRGTESLVPYLASARLRPAADQDGGGDSHGGEAIGCRCADDGFVPAHPCRGPMNSPIRLVAAVLAALSLSPALAQAPAAAPSSAIRIGLIFPLTGGSADMGNSARTGAEVAVSEINQVGGYLGRKLELVIRDDKADNDTGLKHAEELVLKEKVTATIGFCNSGVAMKALDVFQQNKHVLMVTCATGTAITAKYPPAESFIFRTSARDQLQTQFLVDEIVRRGLNKVALLVDTSGYGEAGLKDLEAALGRASLKPQAVVRFKVGVQSLDEEMKQLKASGADSLIGWTVGPEEGVISAARANAGWRVPQFGPWGLSHASAFTVSGGKVDGALMVQTVLPNVFLERNSTFLRN
ncbi:MAG: hypothetical protein EOO24_60895, partial [Comamonadaceae bacterium]